MRTTKMVSTAVSEKKQEEPWKQNTWTLSGASAFRNLIGFRRWQPLLRIHLRDHFGGAHAQLRLMQLFMTLVITIYFHWMILYTTVSPHFAQFFYLILKFTKDSKCICKIYKFCY